MAETLGSLVDKLTIKSIREFYIKKMLRSKSSRFSKPQLKEKLKVVRKQKKLLLGEMEEFIVWAAKGNIVLKEEKLKLYNRPQLIGKIGAVNFISKAINELSKKNLELWRLEDEARREDVSLSYIGRVKKKIDAANQQRNDLIDKIDGLFMERIRTFKRK